VLLLPLASTTAAAAPQAPNLSGPPNPATTGCARLVCAPARPTTAARERQRRGGKEGVNPAGAYLPRSPRGSGSPPEAARRRGGAAPARGAAASSRARGRPVRRGGAAGVDGPWSRSACRQWQCECGWGNPQKKERIPARPSERDEEEGPRQEWDARLPTRPLSLAAFSLCRAARRQPFHLAVAAGWVGLTGEQAQRAGCTWRGPAHAARRV